MDIQLPTDSCYPVFQPLVQLATGITAGYEALLRSQASESPQSLFQAARSDNRLYELDAWSIRQAVAAYFAEPVPAGGCALLFVNVFPSTLLSPRFDRMVQEELGGFRAYFPQIVLEINEADEENKMWEVGELGRAVEKLRGYGFRIALDDVGSGAASLKKIVEYEPDIVKLDRYFGTGLSAHPGKRKLVSLFVEYCSGKQRLVLEGIENPEDLAAARSLGVPIGQGFLLGRPDVLRNQAGRFTAHG
jgi:EAL domain-containing protein (putative c-di-GMP-specific phosphodiesterase class I)